MLASYIENIFLVDFIKHSAVPQFDEGSIFVPPDLYFQNKKEQISSFESLVDICRNEKAVIITGPDRSGKSVIAKKLQIALDGTENPALILLGRQIKNPDIVHLLNTAIVKQYGNAAGYPLSRFKVIIDDFDE